MMVSNRNNEWADMLGVAAIVDMKLDQQLENEPLLSLEKSLTLLKKFSR